MIFFVSFSSIFCFTCVIIIFCFSSQFLRCFFSDISVYRYFGVSDTGFMPLRENISIVWRKMCIFNVMGQHNCQYFLAFFSFKDFFLGKVIRFSKLWKRKEVFRKKIALLSFPRPFPISFLFFISIFYSYSTLGKVITVMKWLFLSG